MKGILNRSYKVDFRRLIPFFYVFESNYFTLTKHTMVVTPTTLFDSTTLILLCLLPKLVKTFLKLINCVLNGILRGLYIRGKDL